MKAITNASDVGDVYAALLAEVDFLRSMDVTAASARQLEAIAGWLWNFWGGEK